MVYRLECPREWCIRGRRRCRQNGSTACFVSFLCGFVGSLGCISILTFARKFLLLLPMRATALCHRYWPEGFCQAARSRGRFGGRSSNPRGEAVPFEACRGPVAQRLEPAAHNGLVAGSSPARPTNKTKGLSLTSPISFVLPNVSPNVIGGRSPAPLHLDNPALSGR